MPSDWAETIERQLYWKMMMEKPLQVTFHNLEHSEAVESDIRARMSKLDTICDRITSGRVVIDSPHRKTRGAKAFTVRIELGLPRSDIVISREPINDIQAAIADAFDIAKRQVRDYVSKNRAN